MSIVRTKKRENPFVQLDKSFINDDTLSWKAKGLLTYILSKPDDWQIHETDIVKRACDGKASVSTGMDELIEKGYVYRYQERAEKGKFGQWISEVYERPLYNPYFGIINSNPPKAENQFSDENLIYPPKADYPISDYPVSENRLLLIKNNTNNDLTNNLSIYQTDKMDENEQKDYRDIVLRNIEYELLKEDYPHEGLIDDITEIIIDVVNSKRKTITVSGENKPANIVRSVFLKLNKCHIEFVIESLNNNTSPIKNIKNYMITTLYNAPNTMNMYYTNRVKVD